MDFLTSMLDSGWPWRTERSARSWSRFSGCASGSNRMEATVLPWYSSTAAWRGCQAKAVHTAIHTPSRVDTSDHLSALAVTILMYDSGGSGALLTPDSVPWNRGNWAATFVGRARRGGRLRRAGEFPGWRIGPGWRRPDAHHRSRLCGAEQPPTAVAFR